MCRMRSAIEGVPYSAEMRNATEGVPYSAENHLMRADDTVAKRVRE